MSLKLTLGTLVPAALLAGAIAAPAQAVSLSFQGRYDGAEEGAAEISAYDPDSAQLYVTNSADNTIDVISILNPMMPELVKQIQLSGGVNSVAFQDDFLAVALAAETETDNGTVAFFDPAGDPLTTVTVGALPDMITFTPDGSQLLVANEGEPSDDYTIDPEGSVSIIDIGTFDVTTVTFDGVPLVGDVRIFGPNATAAQDFEPEYIAVAPDGTKAFVALQENNALAILDLESQEFEKVVGLGFKDFSLDENPIDASNRDDGINIQNWPVFGMYQPDAIAAYEAADGNTYIVTANEGDSRDYDGFSEEERIKDVELDPDAFPNADVLQEDENLGRLKITTTLGDTDGDGDFDELYAYGGRSFSIFDADGNLVFDSAAEFELITAEQVPELFNSQGSADSFDSRSDDKGPEPEGVTIGVYGERTLAFIGLERIGGVMIYDITSPAEAEFLSYSPNLPEDISPEGVLFISRADSPTGQDLLVTTNEVSGTTTVYAVVPEPGTVIGLLSVAAATGLGLKRKRG